MAGPGYVGLGLGFTSDTDVGGGAGDEGSSGGSSEGACEEIKGEAAGEIVRRSIDAGWVTATGQRRGEASVFAGVSCVLLAGVATWVSAKAY